MFDKNKHIKYWIENAFVDFQTAQLLINQKRILHDLFFCHLSIEKALKAHVVKVIENISPRTHNLLYLSELAKIEFSDEFMDLPGILMHYQFEGRYPDFYPTIPSHNEAIQLLNKTKIFLEWLQEML